MIGNPVSLLHRYCRLVDAERLADAAALFTPNGVFELGGAAYTGAAAIRDALAETGRRLGGVRLRHHLTTIDIIDTAHMADTADIADMADMAGTADGRAEAASTAYVLAMGRDGLDHWGHYRDRLAFGPAGWRIAHRRALVDGARAGSPMLDLVTVPGGTDARSGVSGP